MKGTALSRGKRNVEYEMELKFLAAEENESFARTCVAAYAARLNPTLDELADVKAAVSEAVTNAILHGYAGEKGYVVLRGRIEARDVVIEIEDEGVGIADVEAARQPFFTTGPAEERSGMGFTVMETMMDSVEVWSQSGSGTRVTMRKHISQGEK